MKLLTHSYNIRNNYYNIRIKFNILMPVYFYNESFVLLKASAVLLDFTRLYVKKKIVIKSVMNL